MKLLALVFACVLAAYAVDTASVRLDLGDIVSQTLYDPKACAKGQTCYPLVGFGSTGFNRRRGQPIFVWSGTNRPADQPFNGIDSVGVRVGAATIPSAVVATHADDLDLWQYQQGAAGKSVGTDPINVAAAGGPTAAHLQALARLDQVVTWTGRDGSMTAPPFILTNAATAIGTVRQGTGSTPRQNFKLGNWLKASATGVLRCTANADTNKDAAGFIQLWFKNLVPGGLYSVSSVGKLSGAPTAGDDTAGTNHQSRFQNKHYSEELVCGAGCSYFTANWDGTAYYSRPLPGSTGKVACLVDQNRVAPANVDVQVLGWDVRFHSNGIAMGASSSMGTAFGYSPANPFGTTNATPNPFSYGVGMHTHVTVSYPDALDSTALAANLRAQPTISGNFVA